jgi:Ca2+/H+ antiporter, TMEM165/GDT1 family
MSLTAAVTTFVAVLPAEFPDKTVLACLILSSRYRPGFVYAGAATAFAAQVTLSVAAGGALGLLPHRWVQGGAAVIFLIGAVLLWRQRPDQDDTDSDEAGRDGTRDGFWPVATTSFAVVFLAEFGDLTQFLTLSLAARFHDPLSVGAGAVLALWVASGAVILVGWRLLKFIPVTWLTRGAAVIMLALAVTSAVSAAT